MTHVPGEEASCMPQIAQQPPEQVPFAGPAESSREGSARLAVFDFDGTSIAGNSPVLLVQHLMRRKMLKKRVGCRL